MTKRIGYALSIILLCLIIVFSVVAMQYPCIASAESAYSGVLDDLQSDENFNVDDYPADSEDYTLSVIQVAESEDDELFVYVYRPYGGSDYILTATYINMSLTEWLTDGNTVGNENASYKLYSLTLLNESGVFQKYLVNDFIVSSDEVRYYDIASIIREFNSDIDAETDDDNTVNGKAFEVSKCWAASTKEDGSVSYEMQQTEVVTITDMHVGFIRYYDGYEFWSGTSNYVDGHYIAFSTDYDIDKLYEIDISFYTQSYQYTSIDSWIPGGDSTSEYYGEVDSTYYDNPLTLTYEDTVSVDVSGSGWVFWSSKTYTWNRIETAETFLSDEDENLTDETKTDISNMQYVVRFYETEFSTQTSQGSDGVGYTTYYYLWSTVVSEVTILRLKFAMDGVTYNLGVVCDIITGDTVPDGSDSYTTKEWFDDFKEKLKQNLKKILSVIAMLIIFVALLPFLPWIAKFLIWVIKLPFKLLGSLFKAIKSLFSSRKKE